MDRPEGECRGGLGASGIETTIALSGDGSCIAEARHRATAFLTQDDVEDRFRVPARIVDLTQLVVSELVTNACKHAPGPIRVQLHLVGREVKVTVWDRDPFVPAAWAADPHRVGQHGLEIVKAVTEELTVVREGVGKRITARILLDPPSAHDTRRTAI
ncbi:ATP-binding protein [Streptomyces sp. NPDC007905]|uniref:ATP-binding protein n=1 Tax=Streptomyces sp. NPDC007905 TaxID=3364788 RepID=UPI0036E47632